MLRPLPEPQALPVAEDPPPTYLYPGSLKLLAVICITAIRHLPNPGAMNWLQAPGNEFPIRGQEWPESPGAGVFESIGTHSQTQNKAQYGRDRAAKIAIVTGKAPHCLG